MLNFPDSPTAGTVFGAWRYDGVKWGAVSGVSGGGSAGDITAVLAGTGLSGGGTEGDVSLALAVPVTVARGGTGATDAATALTNLGGAPLASPTFTGDPKAPTPATSDNDTSIATTAYVKSQGYQTGNQTITLSGDASGSGTTAITTTLATVNANVGTFQGLTVNAKGLVTGAANQSYLTSPVNLTSQVTGTLPVANGGTGATTGNVGPYLPLVAGSGNALTGALSIAPASGYATMTMTKQAASGTACNINAYKGSTLRWALVLGDETNEAGSNSGSNLIVNSFNDAGAYLATPLTINRATGRLTYTSNVDFIPAGTNTPTTASLVRIGMVNGAVAVTTRAAVAGTVYPLGFENVNGVLVGTVNSTDSNTSYNTTSDGRLKEDLKDFDAGPIIDAIHVYDFAWKASGERACGIIAQEAIEVYQQAITHDEVSDSWGVDYSKYVPLLLQEVKALRARVAALEAK